MFSLNDAQLALVMTAAGSLPAEKRSVLLEGAVARQQLEVQISPTPISAPRYKPHCRD
jgi:hypothetical protein